MTELDRIRECSHYLAMLLRRPELVDWLWERRNLYRRYPLIELYRDLADTAGQASSFEDLLLLFRRFKQRHFLRIGGRDFLGRADLEETVSQLSDLACVVLQVGLDVLCDHPQWWLGAEGERGRWEQIRRNHLQVVIMGLGKLGGQELNYVSDIDLLFLHDLPENTVSDSPEIPVILSSLFQWLFRLVSDKVEGDRVFQVDLRLRPRGKDGELVPSLAGAADYYLFHGRSWERQMLLKARSVAGDRSLGTAFLREVRPFVFRRFLDFQSLDEIRSMRDRILKEAIRPRPGWEQFDVKLGVGGIREIEFIVQSLQLIYGGRHPELDEPNTLRCLSTLAELKLLPPRVVDELREAYIFLRRVEHWVQLDQNRQTQKLPQSREASARLATALGFEGGEKGFLEKLGDCCTTVHRHFLALFQAADRSEGMEDSSERLSEMELSRRFDALDAFPREPCTRLRDHLKPFSPSVRANILKVLESFASIGDPAILEAIPVRLERYFSQVRRRPGLVKQFDAPMPWLQDLCRTLVQSRLVSDLLAFQPSLVEGVLHGSELCPRQEEWEADAERLLHGREDFEEQMEWIRRLKNERLLQLILSDLRGELDHETLEKHLTDLADFFLQRTYYRVLEQVGLPPDLPLAVLGLGKLGSREMGYLSDLDLVFVYRPRPQEPQDQIPPDVIRLIQRFMRMLSIPLHEGPGYSVDARLRPTGSYGPLVVTRTAWLDYYREHADLWEIQALLRMRCVLGPVPLCRWVEEKARGICYQERDPSEVWARICHLRQRMQKERSRERPDAVDLKVGMGGLVDLEFLVQGHLLISGYRHPSVGNGSPFRVALRALAEELSGVEMTAEELQTAFETLRTLEHRLRLYTNLPPSLLSMAQFEALQSVRLWPPISGVSPAETWQDILRIRKRVRNVLRHWCPDL